MLPIYKKKKKQEEGTIKMEFIKIAYEYELITSNSNALCYIYGGRFVFCTFKIIEAALENFHLIPTPRTSGVMVIPTTIRILI